MCPSEWVIDLALSDGAQRGVFFGGAFNCQRPAMAATNFFTFHAGRGKAATGINQP
ncbi:hypothetical protein D3C80_1976270 [compost metagenome]|jgi:hypothetical protein